MRRNTQTQEGQGPQPSDTPNKINGLPARLRLKSRFDCGLSLAENARTRDEHAVLAALHIDFDQARGRQLLAGYE